jgi:hypothetical protein
MKKITAILIFLTLSYLLPAQIKYTLQHSFPEISLTDFITEVEQNNNVRFFFPEKQADTITLTNLISGTSVTEILKDELAKHKLNLYTDGDRIFIYPGSQIVSELPEFDIPIKELHDSMNYFPGANEGEKMFIPTWSELNKLVKVIGDPKKLVPGKKCMVNGSIINQRDNEPILGATIYIKELELGIKTDALGSFEMELLPGNYTISVNHLSMKETLYELHVFTSGELPIELENEIIELQEFTISSERFDNVKNLQMGVDRISMKTMKEIPLVLGERDVLKVAQLLPGVQSVGEGSSGFNVRGGSTDQNLFYINNISIYNTSHLFGFFTSFSPDIINDFTLYKNNIPTKYGGRLASVFEISTRDGNKEKVFAHGGISPVTGHFSIEGPIVKQKITYVASIRSTYSDWLLKRMKDPNLRESNASFYDGTLGVNFDLNEKNQLKVFYYRSSDKFSLSSTNDYKYSNSGGSAIWKHTFSPVLSSDISLASSNYRFSTNNKTNVSEAYTQDYSIYHTEFRANLMYKQSERHTIESGFSTILYNLNRGSILPFGQESTRTPIELGKENGLENAIYISDEFRILRNLQLLAGMRYSIYSMLGPGEVLTYLEGSPLEAQSITGSLSFNSGKVIKTYSGFEPRIVLNYNINNNTSVKASYNRLQQYIFLLSNTIAMAPTDQWKLTDYHISPPKSDQISVGFYHDFRNEGITLSTELYRKWTNGVVDYKNGANFISSVAIEQQLIQGTQNSKGVEVMLKKKSKNLTGWISYAYSRSLMEMNSMHPEERINNGYAYPSNFDRPHSLNIISNYRLNRRLSVSTNIVYSTGRPITLPVAIYYNQGQKLLVFSDRNEYRIPDYFRTDLSFNLEGNLKFQKLGHSYWMLNIYNLTGRANAYSVFYRAENGNINGYKLSIFARQIVTLSWNIKLGNYSND